ncbi:MAG: serine/threonine protein kinase, partial [Clostridiales bacterium]|nr:serine/threonine protein kinase [Clostridiales bacterium]
MSQDSHAGREALARQGLCPYCLTRLTTGGRCPNCGLTDGVCLSAPHHLPLGTVLNDRYLVGRALGEGGFGVTYLGYDRCLGTRVAVKEYFPVDLATRTGSGLAVLPRTGPCGQEYDLGLKRFLTEARTMARMEKQPQIVLVRDYFESNGTAYIAMEYVEGTSFVRLVEQWGGRIPTRELLPLVDPLFSALQAVHQAGLIHRDISPDNLMVERGVVRLLDFGCAREATQGSETLTVALKRGYAPIEQYQCKGQGPWTDVYALSATLYFCLTGRVPPPSLDRVLEDELVSPRVLGADLTAGQEAALLKGLAGRPRRRYQSVEELHAGLY